MSIPGAERWINFINELWSKFQNDRVLDGAAVLAFFFVLAVFPAVIFILALLPLLAIPHLQKALMDLLHQVLPQQSARFFQGAVHSVASEGTEDLLTFGLIFALWSGSTGLYAVIEQLNIIYEVEDRRPLWKARGIAILLMLFIALTIIGSLSLAILGGVIQSWAASILGWSQPLLIFFAAVRWIILSAALLLVLAVAYRFGPDVRVKFRFLSAGNITAAIIIALASVGLQLYVSTFGNYSATYGSLAAVIILMLWMYMAGIALLVGCEINILLHPHKPDPSRPALPAL